MLLQDPGSGDQRGHFLLFDNFPVDKFLDIGMIQVQGDHLGRPPGGASGLDRAGSAIPDFQKTHQSGRFTATTQLFPFAPDLGEVGSGAGTVFKQTGFPHPEIHDTALIHQIILDALDKAGVRLGMRIRILGTPNFPAFRIHIVMALRGTVDAVGPVQARVEPLRAVRRRHLMG